MPKGGGVLQPNSALGWSWGGGGSHEKGDPAYGPYGGPREEGVAYQGGTPVDSGGWIDKIKVMAEPVGLSKVPTAHLAGRDLLIKPCKLCFPASVALLAAAAIC